MSSPVYAYLTSVARYFKSSLLKREDLDSLLAAKDLRELVEVMRDKGIVENVQVNSAEQLLSQVKKRANSFLNSLRNLAYNSLIVKKAIDIYVALLNADEIESAISYLIYKERGARVNLRADRLLLLASYSDSMDSVQSLVQAISKDYPRIAEAINSAVGNKGAELNLVNGVLEAHLFSSLYKLVTSLRGDWQATLKRILCGYMDYYSLSLAYTLKRSDIEGCTVEQDAVRNVASSPQLLVDVIKGSEWGKLVKANTPLEALAEMKTIVRRNARKASYQAFEGDPFSPAGSIAVAELIRLDYQDLVAIITGIDARLKREKVAEKLSFELV